jgi:hypothetical protein
LYCHSYATIFPIGVSIGVWNDILSFGRVLEGVICEGITAGAGATSAAGATAGVSATGAGVIGLITSDTFVFEMIAIGFPVLFAISWNFEV